MRNCRIQSRSLPERPYAASFVIKHVWNDIESLSEVHIHCVDCSSLIPDAVDIAKYIISIRYCRTSKWSTHWVTVSFAKTKV